MSFGRLISSSYFLLPEETLHTPQEVFGMAGLSNFLELDAKPSYTIKAKDFAAKIGATIKQDATKNLIFTKGGKNLILKKNQYKVVSGSSYITQADANTIQKKFGTVSVTPVQIIAPIKETRLPSPTPTITPIKIGKYKIKSYKYAGKTLYAVMEGLKKIKGDFTTKAAAENYAKSLGGIPVPTKPVISPVVKTTGLSGKGVGSYRAKNGITYEIWVRPQTASIKGKKTKITKYYFYGVLKGKRVTKEYYSGVSNKSPMALKAELDSLGLVAVPAAPTSPDIYKPDISSDGVKQVKNKAFYYIVFGGKVVPSNFPKSGYYSRKQAEDDYKRLTETKKVIPATQQTKPAEAKPKLAEGVARWWNGQRYRYILYFKNKEYGQYGTQTEAYKQLNNLRAQQGATTDTEWKEFFEQQHRIVDERVKSEVKQVIKQNVPDDAVAIKTEIDRLRKEGKTSSFILDAAKIFIDTKYGQKLSPEDKETIAKFAPDVIKQFVPNEWRDAVMEASKETAITEAEGATPPPMPFFPAEVPILTDVLPEQAKPYSWLILGGIGVLGVLAMTQRGEKQPTSTAKRKKEETDYEYELEEV